MSKSCEHCGELWCDYGALGQYTKYIGHRQECPMYNVGVMEQRLRDEEHQAEQRARSEGAVISGYPDHKYCGFCGKAMRESANPHYRYNRATGEGIACGYVMWACPAWELWESDAWTNPSKHPMDVTNPHDSKFLRAMNAEASR